MEWAVLLFGLSGLGFSIWGLATAWIDLTFLTASNVNGARRVVALQNITKESFRMTLQTIIVIVGAVCVLNAPPPPDYRMLPQSLIAIVAWLISSGLLSVWVVLDRVRRIQLEHIYDAAVTAQRRRKTDHVIAIIHQEQVTKQPPPP